MAMDRPVEAGALLVVDDDEVGGDETIQRSLAGKLWTENPFNTRAFKQTIVDAWRLKKPVEVQELGKNLFLFTFSSKRDLENVLNSGPWNFDRHVVVLKRITGIEQPSEMALDTTSLWARVYDLPLRLRTENMAIRLGNMMGTFEEADNRDCNRIGKFLRVKIYLDLKQAVKRGTVIRFQGKDLKVYFRYERLPAFCFICGKLGHQMKECDEAENQEENDYAEFEDKDLPFGPWLRASPLPKQNMEARKESQSVSCSKSLFTSSKSSTAEASGIARNDVEVVQTPAEKEPTLAQLVTKRSLAAKQVEEVADSLGAIGLTPKIPVSKQKDGGRSTTQSKPKEAPSKERKKAKSWVRKKGKRSDGKKVDKAKQVGLGKRNLFDDDGIVEEDMDVGGSQKKQATRMEVDATNYGPEGVLVDQHLLPHVIP